MFTLEEVEEWEKLNQYDAHSTEENFYTLLERDIGTEINKIGPIKRIKVFEVIFIYILIKREIRMD